MTWLQYFIRGLLVGFSIAAPVGPIGVLCIRRTLAQGRLAGLVSGLGAATADAFYGSVAALGLVVISSFLVGQRFWLGLGGGFFLCYLGLRTLLAKPSSSAPGQVTQPDPPQSLWSLYASTFVLTLTNPMTILSFTAIFAGLGLGNTGGDRLAGLLLVLGVFCGSALWWLLLSGLANVLRKRFLTPRGLQWVNWISGAVITGFGILALISLI